VSYGSKTVNFVGLRPETNHPHATPGIGDAGIVMVARILFRNHRPHLAQHAVSLQKIVKANRAFGGVREIDASGLPLVPAVIDAIRQESRALEILVLLLQP
jgi:hypothetical protein